MFICKKCEGKRNMEYNKKHPKQFKLAHRKYYANHPNAQREWGITITGKFAKYCYQAKRRKIGWELTKEQFAKLIYQRCHYCGVSQKDGVGIDRRDSSIGYTYKNSLPCCSQCNYMKMAYPYDSFIQKVKDIYNNLNLEGKS